MDAGAGSTLRIHSLSTLDQPTKRLFERALFTPLRKDVG